MSRPSLELHDQDCLGVVPPSLNRHHFHSRTPSSTPLLRQLRPTIDWSICRRGALAHTLGPACQLVLVRSEHDKAEETALCTNGVVGTRFRVPVNLGLVSLLLTPSPAARSLPPVQRSQWLVATARSHWDLGFGILGFWDFYRFETRYHATCEIFSDGAPFFVVEWGFVLRVFGGSGSKIVFFWRELTANVQENRNLRMRPFLMGLLRDLLEVEVARFSNRTSLDGRNRRTL